jgi:hypothetical protein
LRIFVFSSLDGKKRQFLCQHWLETFRILNSFVTQQGITVFLQHFVWSNTNHFDCWNLLVGSEWFLLILHAFLRNGQSVNANSVLIRAFCRLWDEMRLLIYSGIMWDRMIFKELPSLYWYKKIHLYIISTEAKLMSRNAHFNSFIHKDQEFVITKKPSLHRI